MATEAELEKIVEIAGHGGYNVVILLVSSTIHLAATLDLLSFCVTAPAASCDLQLGMAEISLLTSIPFAGYVSALPWGYYADMHGRRRAILVSASVGSILGIMTSFASSFTMMLVLKFLGCTFSTACITLTITYLGECTCSKYRTKYMFILNCFNLGSDLVCYALAYFILRMEFNVDIPWLAISYRPWRLFTLSMSLMLGAGAVMMFFLHESPKFLANKGDVDQALHVLKTAYGVKEGTEELVTNSLLFADKKLDSTKTTFWNSVVQQTVPIFQPPLLIHTVQLFFLLSVCCSTNNVFFMWFPTMVNSFFNSIASDDSSFCDRITSNITTTIENNVVCDSTISNATIFSGMAFSTFFTIVNYGTSLISNYRKSVLIITLTIAGLSTVIVDLIYQPIISILLFILIQLAGVSGGNVCSYFNDVYPTTYRGLGTSLGSMTARISSMIGVYIVGSTIVDHCRITFFAWSIFVFVGVAAAWSLPAEKKKLNPSTDPS
ncbi:putative transporter svop-1 isoform X1 [Manduca sexta]|nr:putative transporter svop-1 isoform X1 [Manduca sexta]KAG6463202.1 hypothetical protein O3G_MSEX013734 [Manduca sexta]